MFYRKIWFRIHSKTYCMNLSQELIDVLEKSMRMNEQLNPYIIQGVLKGIREGCPEADKLISRELEKWAQNMWSR